MQIARLGDLIQSYPLIHRLNSLYGEGSTALVVDDSLADFAGFIVGEGNVVRLPVKSLLEAGRGEGINRPWRLARQLQKQLSALKTQSVINLNYHRAAAAVAEAIPAVEWLGARYVDVVAGTSSDLQLAEIFKASTGIRDGERHLSDIWCDYASNGCWEITEDMTTVDPINSGCWDFLKLPSEISSIGRKLLMRKGIGDEAPIALIPGSGHPDRRYPAWAWRLTAVELAKYAPVVIIGTEIEAQIADEITSGLQHVRLPNKVVSLCGETNLKELAGALTNCSLAVGVDTGSLHMAAMLGVACLGIYFGSMHYRETGPYSNIGAVVTPDDPDYPCHEAELERVPYDPEQHIPARAVVQVIKSIFMGGRIDAPEVKVFQADLDNNGLTWEADKVFSGEALMNRVAHAV